MKQNLKSSLQTCKISLYKSWFLLSNNNKKLLLNIKYALQNDVLRIFNVHELETYG